MKKYLLLAALMLPVTASAGEGGINGFLYGIAPTTNRITSYGMQGYAMTRNLQASSHRKYVYQQVQDAGNFEQKLRDGGFSSWQDMESHHRHE